MNRKIRTVALFAVLSLAAASCQKENDVYPMVGPEQTTETIQVTYSINGEVYQATINESEWDAFIERMLALARKGYEVSFSRNGNSLVSQSKEKLTFVTTDSDKAEAWVKDKIKKGYAVTVTFDQNTGEYTCIAIK